MGHGGYVSVSKHSWHTHMNTELYLYYLLICPLWSCPGYLKSDLVLSDFHCLLSNSEVIQLPFISTIKWCVLNICTVRSSP